MPAIDLGFTIFTIAKPPFEHMIMVAAQRIFNQVKPLVSDGRTGVHQTGKQTPQDAEFFQIGKQNLPARHYTPKQVRFQKHGHA